MFLRLFNDAIQLSGVMLRRWWGGYEGWYEMKLT